MSVEVKVSLVGFGWVGGGGEVVERILERNNSKSGSIDLKAEVTHRFGVGRIVGSYTFGLIARLQIWRY